MTNAWEAIHQLGAEAHFRYEALGSGVRAGVSDHRQKELFEAWQEAHRLWWNAVQEQLAKDQAT